MQGGSAHTQGTQSNMLTANPQSRRVIHLEPSSKKAEQHKTQSTAQPYESLCRLSRHELQPVGSMYPKLQQTLYVQPILHMSRKAHVQGQNSARRLGPVNFMNRVLLAAIKEDAYRANEDNAVELIKGSVEAFLTEVIPTGNLNRKYYKIVSNIFF